MKQIILSNASLSVGIMPDLGACLSFMRFHKEGRSIEILRELNVDAQRLDVNNAALFTMVPFSNRIRGGSFVYFGITRKMAKNQSGLEDPIHGDGWKSVWHVVEQTPTKAILQLDHDKAKGGFPFSYTALLTYTLKNATLTIETEVLNPSALPMPCGLGVHPFFKKHADTTLQFETRTVWANESDPIFDKPYETPIAWDFKNPQKITEDFDTCFGGFGGDVIIRTPSQGVQVHMQADPLFGHVVLYAPKYKRYFCVEPATNANDAFNLAFRGVVGTGIQSIGPHQKLKGTVSLTVADL